MSFSVSDFTSKFGDLARSFMFKCIFTPPAGVFNPYEKITVLVESTALPTKTIAEVEANFMGQQVKLAGNITYDNWTCNFRMDDKMEVYQTFREWSDLVRDANGNMRTPAEYKAGMVLQQLDGSQNTIGTLQIFGAFPSVLGEITYDTKASDVQIFPVTFAYDFHTWSK